MAATLVLAELGEERPSGGGLCRADAYPPRLGRSVRRRSRLSKAGNARLRKVLYFPALTALRCNAAIQAFGARLAERSKAKMVIVAAAMRKLLHICYGVLTSAHPFDASLHPDT